MFVWFTWSSSLVQQFIQLKNTCRNHVAAYSFHDDRFFHHDESECVCVDGRRCQFLLVKIFFHLTATEPTVVLFKSVRAEIWIFFLLGITFRVGSLTCHTYIQYASPCSLNIYLERALFFCSAFALAPSPLLSLILFLILPICHRAGMRYNKCLFYIC